MPEGFTPNPGYEAKQAKEIAERRSQADCDLAVKILDIASRSTAGQSISADNLANYAELLWKWVTTDEWPK